MFSATYTHIKFYTDILQAPITLETPEQIRTFFQKEQDEWEWLENASKHNEQLFALATFRREFLSTVIEIASKENSLSQGSETFYRTIQLEILQARTNYYIFADSPEGKFVLDLRQKQDNTIAAYALAFLSNIDFDTSQPLAYAGLCAVSDFYKHYNW